MARLQCAALRRQRCGRQGETQCIYRDCRPGGALAHRGRPTHVLSLFELLSLFEHELPDGLHEPTHVCMQIFEPWSIMPGARGA